MPNVDKEKLRAFEQKMHDEGADGFADGPRPWETWDESGAQAGTGRHIWEGKARRIYRNTPIRRSLGDRILSGLAMIALATMVVGIAGVYFTEERPQTIAWTAVQPTPIPLPGQRETAASLKLPARVLRPAPVIAKLETLPPPATNPATPGSDTAAAETATDAILAHAEPDFLPANATAESSNTGTASVAIDGPEEDPVASSQDVEIVTTPAGLLLTSSTGAYPGDSDTISGYNVFGTGVDPALAMEIATAPAADNNINIDRDTGATTAVMATGKTGPGNGMQVALLPGTDTINRDTASADLPAAGGTLPETAGTNAGLAHTEVPETAAAATAGNADPARFATAPAETTATSEMAATLEQLPPAAAGPATAAADAADPAAETPADTSTPAQGMPPADTPAAGGTIVALAEPAPAAAAPAPATAAAAATAGDWVVNLASYTYQSMARRKLAEFQSKGVNGEIEHVTVNDKPLYRIRVTGFASSRAARTSISSLEENLGLKGAWISRR